MKSSAILMLSIIFDTFIFYSLAAQRRFRSNTRRSPPDLSLLTEVIADTVLCGAYTIAGCGYYAQTACRQVQELSLALNDVVEDVKNGLRSQHGYGAFFKSDASISFVMHVFGHIMLGLPRPDLSSLQVDDAHSPWLVCESGLSILGLDLWSNRAPAIALSLCHHNDGPTAFFLRKSRFVVLCNKFWDLPRVPSAGISTCAVVSGNKFVGSSENEGIGAKVPAQQKSLVDYRRYHLLYVLIDFYLNVVSLEYPDNSKPALDWNRCIQLSPLDARTNPSNYQLYAANVIARCRDFPSVTEASHMNTRDLSETSRQASTTYFSEQKTKAENNFPENPQMALQYPIQTGIGVEL